ncbi:hypothetical protein ACFOLC_14605 [Lysobacter cavernae]|uniref:Lipoprotein n=1 Tax=Lysobacter cavernae TaxID=1685901 RepID=A0ABV7RU81_9GAMM
MSLRPAATISIAAALVVALAGCVAFEQPPSAQLGCDTKLAGHWLPEGENNGVEVKLDQQCRAHFPPRDNGRLPAYDTTVRSFTLDGHDYLVLTAHDVEQILGLATSDFAATAPAGSVFVLRYRIDGDRLQALQVDADFVAKAIASRRIRGREASKTLLVIEGDAPAMTALLRAQPALFDTADTDKAMRLRRSGATP